jgi:hypothetical protein
MGHQNPLARIILNTPCPITCRCQDWLIAYIALNTAAMGRLLAWHETQSRLRGLSIV